MKDSLTVTISRKSMKRFQEKACLDERQVRILMGMLADQLGDGGVQVAARAFEVELNTVAAGKAEFTGNSENDLPAKRVRRPGRGRKPAAAGQSAVATDGESGAPAAAGRDAAAGARAGGDEPAAGTESSNARNGADAGSGEQSGDGTGAGSGGVEQPPQQEGLQDALIRVIGDGIWMSPGTEPDLSRYNTPGARQRGWLYITEADLLRNAKGYWQLPKWAMGGQNLPMGATALAEARKVRPTAGMWPDEIAALENSAAPAPASTGNATEEATVRAAVNKEGTHADTEPAGTDEAATTNVTTEAAPATSATTEATPTKEAAERAEIKKASGEDATAPGSD